MAQTKYMPMMMAPEVIRVLSGMGAVLLATKKMGIMPKHMVIRMSTKNVPKLISVARNRRGQMAVRLLPLSRLKTHE